MSDFESIFQGIMLKEGGVSNDPADHGGRTQYGVSEAAHPAAWVDGKVTEAEAREIFLAKYVIWPKFNLIPSSHSHLQEQLIDFGYNSGPGCAIRKLQTLLGVKGDGVLGTVSLDALSKSDPRVINNRLATSRALMIGKLVANDVSQVKFLVGLLDRALSFII